MKCAHVQRVVAKHYGSIDRHWLLCLQEVRSNMRLIAVPLARAKPGLSPVSTFLAQRSPIPPSFVSKRGEMAAKDTDKNVTGKNKDQTPPSTQHKPPLSSRIMAKAAEFWVGLGREDQTSPFDWKRRTYSLGERLMDRIEYEEWALKGIDPALGPTLNPNERKDRSEEKGEETKLQQKVNDGIEHDKSLPVGMSLNVSVNPMHVFSAYIHDSLDTPSLSCITSFPYCLASLPSKLDCK